MTLKEKAMEIRERVATPMDVAMQSIIEADGDIEVALQWAIDYMQNRGSTKPVLTYKL